MSAAEGGDAAERRAPLSTAALAALSIAAIPIVAGLVALGTWQLERRAWKLDLIERVRQRVHAPAAAAPGPADWPGVSAARDEYRRVSVSGTFLHDRETLVQASTALGSGFWVLTPLRGGGGAVVLVNRGFVPPERRDRAVRSAGDSTDPVTVSGLLRVSEPGGGFLRRNDPSAERWTSRDVGAIGSARGLGVVAPYFIDAEATAASQSGAGPVGGLTVIDFANNHLVYAITWYALALMAAAGAGRVMLEEMRLRRRREHAGSETPHLDRQPL